MHVTHVGGPTVLLEVSGWRILTDPTFDPPGRTYGFGWGTSSRKTVGPALSLEDLGDIDLVLLSHDHHADNLDDAGRALLSAVGKILTTKPGARRLKQPHAIGLKACDTIRVRSSERPDAPARPDLLITATPARHGPFLSRLIVGAVVGFRIESTDHTVPATWMTGDSVLYRRLRKTAEADDVDVLILHLGNVGFPTTGPVQYSMDAEEGLDLARSVDPQVIIPVHYDGWSHFRQPTSALERTIRAAPAQVRRRIVQLTPGQRHTLDVTPRGHLPHGHPSGA